MGRYAPFSRKNAASSFLRTSLAVNADDGVLAGIEILRKLEDLDADGAFLESAPGPANGVLDDVLEELPGPPRPWPERRNSQEDG